MGTGFDGPARARWRRAVPQGAAALTVALSALLFALRPLSLEMPIPDLDGSWTAVLGEAATIPARWGVDLAFSYGPASALVTRYFTEGYLAAAVPAALLLTLVLGLCIARLAAIGAAGRRRARALVLVMAGAQALGLPAAGAQIPDGFFFAFAFDVFLLDVLRPPRDVASRLVVLAGAAAMGAAALSKGSYGVAAIALFALADARSAVILRRWPLLTPVFLLAFLAGFAAFGQRLADLPLYLARVGDMASGYGAAMSLAGPGAELAGFLAASAGLVAVAASAARPRTARAQGDRISAAVATAGVLLILLLAFKAGFVRQDGHAQIGWSTLGLVGLSVATALAPRRRIAPTAMLAAASLGSLWIVAPLALPSETADPRDALGIVGSYRLIGSEAAAEVGAWARLVQSPSRFEAAARAAKAAALAAIRAGNPLPSLVGTVDILPSQQTSVLAAGLDYHPRPAFQDYSTYTADLIAANVAFYRGPSAPEWVLFGIGGLDDRYPALTEGALWPDLLSLYEPVQRAGALLALHRRAVPLPDALGDPRRRTVGLGEPFAVPAGPVFARIVVRETLLGRLASMAFRPPALALNVTLADGEAHGSRLVPALAAGGFLLSPEIDDASGYALLATGEAESLEGRRVTQAVVGGSRLASLFYAPDVALEFRSLTVAPGEPGERARDLSAELARRRPWRRLVRRIAPDGVFEAERLAAPAPASFTVPIEGARRLKVGFGVEDGAWTVGRVAGVCFSVEAASGRPAPLWQRCLDPLGVVADRGSQTAEVDVPSGLAAVAVKTSCRQSCDWGWSYWDDIEPEG